jgi:anti-anti-sigma factor
MSTKHEDRWLERQDCGDVTVVRLKLPEIPHEESVRAVFDPIYSLVSDVGRNKLVLNLAAVEWLPSMALGKLVMLNRKAQAADGRLVLSHLCPTVQQSLESTHLAESFDICATEQEALQSFS